MRSKLFSFLAVLILACSSLDAQQVEQKPLIAPYHFDKEEQQPTINAVNNLTTVIETAVLATFNAYDSDDSLIITQKTLPTRFTLYKVGELHFLQISRDDGYINTYRVNKNKNNNKWRAESPGGQESPFSFTLTKREFSQKYDGSMRVSWY
jgi:hypothetical protein